jgi:hypothetical protein
VGEEVFLNHLGDVEIGSAASQICLEKGFNGAVGFLPTLPFIMIHEKKCRIGLRVEIDQQDPFAKMLSERSGDLNRKSALPHASFEVDETDEPSRAFLSEG